MIIKIAPDKEKAKSILKLIENREKFLSFIDINEFPKMLPKNIMK